VRVLRVHEAERVPETGAVQSVQEAEVAVPQGQLESLWRPGYLERLARSYWRFLNRISLGLIRVVYAPDSRTIVLLSPRIPLLRFDSPEYETSELEGAVTWRIRRGILVAPEGRGHGFLRIAVRRRPPSGGGPELVNVLCEVRNFYPWLRGRGRFARFGAWLYANTQMRIHVVVCNAFLRSLARLDLAPSRIGALAGEIDRGAAP
jgi:hypothetical protein